MALQVIGAGLGRTGTYSLKLALERLLGAPCYHMATVFESPQHVPVWAAAANGDMPGWDQLFHGFSAAVDWPASAFWQELSEAYPDAPVLLSTRDSDAWWASASKTIFPTIEKVGGQMPAWRDMILAIMASRFVPDLKDKDACIAAYERHNALVRATIPPERLIDWQPGDGWEPVCSRLNLPIPYEPFPHANTREEFLSRLA
jgi:hypothetical protein